GDELPRDDLAVADRIRPEELERAELPLLGEEPHREERHEHEQQALDVEELVLPEAARQIHPTHQHEEPEVRVEEVSRQHEEHGGERVEEERREVERELLRRDREDRHEASPPSTRRRKISSRSAVSWRSSRMTQPRRSSTSPAARTGSPSPPVSSTNAPPSTSTRSTPGTAASAAATSADGPSTRRTSRRRRPSRALRSPGVPSPTRRPRAMTITRSHTASTSERMWLEKKTVRVPRRSWISSRISTTW